MFDPAGQGERHQFVGRTIATDTYKLYILQFLLMKGNNQVHATKQSPSMVNIQRHDIICTPVVYMNIMFCKAVM